ncbi:MAG TPA: hypothetical protein V6C97_29880 [Oculatellaceae cyanobacterium]
MYKLRLINPKSPRWPKPLVIGLLSVVGFTYALPSQIYAGSVKSTVNDGKVYCIHQNTVPLGPVELFLSNSAVRVNAHQGDVQITARAPNWDVVLYSKSKNEGYRVVGNERSSQLGLLNCPVPLEGDGVKRMDSVLKVPSLVFSIDCRKKDFSSERSIFFQTQEKRKIVQLNYKLWDKEFNPDVTNFLGWFYSERQYPKLPLEQNIKYDTGDSTRTFSTILIEKVSVAPSYFDYPHYSQSAHHKLDVLLSTDAVNILEDMWGDVKPARVPGKL